MWKIWLIVSAVALIIDVATSSFLFVWFTIGGIAALIAFSLGGGTASQAITFCVVSSVCMAIGYPIVKKTIKKTVKRTPTQEENYIGKEFTLDEDVNEKALIKIEGIYWTVKNEGEPAEKGDRVRIIDIQGNKLVIKKL